MSVLIIEDEPKIREFLRRGLEEEGYTVEVAADGEAGLDLASANAYDLIILDLLLPRRDGLDVCRALRGQGRATPVLMLTARDAVSDRVTGLDVGADDYLTKPFAFEGTQRDPGYIQAYPPGVRENGGQYTHAAAWFGWAHAQLGDGAVQYEAE